MSRITSLCPALGRKYSLMKHGMCPSNLQHPGGKEIPVSVRGGNPYVTYDERKNWTGGVEFEVMKLYAKRFDFQPVYINASTFSANVKIVSKMF